MAHWILKKKGPAEGTWLARSERLIVPSDPFMGGLAQPEDVTHSRYSRADKLEPETRWQLIIDFAARMYSVLRTSPTGPGNTPKGVELSVSRCSEKSGFENSTTWEGKYDSEDF